jgi:NitT/TauT family transport system permease protein/sulfonate transport system permease protein
MASAAMSGGAVARTPLVGKSVAYRIGYRLIADGLPVMILFLWYYESLHQPEFILPSPIKVAIRTTELFGLDRQLASNTWDSVQRVLMSVVIAMLLGAFLVIVAKYVPIFQGFVVGRVMTFFNAAPALGWAIVGVYWFHVSDIGVIFVEVAILLPFSMINLWEGLKNLDEELVEMASSFSRNRIKTLFAVVLPMLLPYLFAALRVSYGTAWKVALFAELFGAPSGLGYLLNIARESFDSVTVFACFVTLIILVYAVQYAVFNPLEWWLTPQRRSAFTQA